jgi:hypothetical protein
MTSGQSSINPKRLTFKILGTNISNELTNAWRRNADSFRYVEAVVFTTPWLNKAAVLVANTGIARRHCSTE